MTVFIHRRVEYCMRTGQNKTLDEITDSILERNLLKTGLISEYIIDNLDQNIESQYLPRNDTI